MLEIKRCNVGKTKNYNYFECIDHRRAVKRSPKLDLLTDGEQSLEVLQQLSEIRLGKYCLTQSNAILGRKGYSTYVNSRTCGG